MERKGKAQRERPLVDTRVNIYLVCRSECGVLTSSSEAGWRRATQWPWDHRDFLVGIASASQEERFQSIKSFDPLVSSCPDPQTLVWMPLIDRLVSAIK
jgi:hypothetical protein